MRRYLAQTIRFTRRSRGLVSVSIERRRALRSLAFSGAALLVPHAWAAAGKVASARLWPAEEYTRLILESAAPLAYKLQTLSAPDRLVLDLGDVEWTTDLAD